MSTLAKTKSTAPRINARATTRVRRSDANPILRIVPLVALFYSFLLVPIEVKLSFAGLNFYSYRIAIVLFLPMAIFFAPRRGTRFGLLDLLVFFGSIWVIISLIYHLGAGTGFVRSSAIFMDIFGAYLIGRLCITTLTDLRRTLVLIVPGLLFAAGFLAVESISGNLIVRPFFTSIFGRAVVYSAGDAAGSLELINEYRLGLLRAYSTFSYPILAGAILGSLLPLYIKSGLRSWALFFGVLACAMSFFSLSSAALAGLAMSLILVTLDYLMPRIKAVSWPIIVSLGAIYAFLANMVLETGFVGLIQRFTLNPMTAYVRRMQWKYGSENVAEHPVFGIAFREYDRPFFLTASIDAHFLHLALRHGLITPVMLLIAAFSVMFLIGKAAPRFPRADRNLLVGINFMLAILLFISMTVTYFSEANIFFLASLGFAVSCANFKQPPKRLIRRRILSPKERASAGTSTEQAG
ncbi:MAG: hypothetical protein WA985_06440 [Erythrobacter sp.]